MSHAAIRRALDAAADQAERDRSTGCVVYLFAPGSDCIIPSHAMSGLPKRVRLAINLLLGKVACACPNAK